MTDEARLKAAFLLGFLASREGYNGEGAHENLAPDVLFDRKSNCNDESGRARLVATPEFRRLREQAIVAIESMNDEPERDTRTLPLPGV